MSTYVGGFRPRRAARLAFGAAGPALAAVLLSLGYSLLFDPRAAGDLARLGLGPGLRVSLGLAHLAGGLALLVPSATGPAALLLGFVTAAVAADLFALGRGFVAAGPAATAAALVAYAAYEGARRRSADEAWRGMVRRYGDEADAGRDGGLGPGGP